MRNLRYFLFNPFLLVSASHSYSNALLFNLQFHSDHHANAGLPFTILKHDESSPQLPAGYPAMILLAQIPTLWFKVIDKKLSEWNREFAQRRLQD